MADRGRREAAAGDLVVAAARGWIGTPYVPRAALRGVGCDCVGLVRGVLAEVAGGALIPAPPWRSDWHHSHPLFDAACAHLLPSADPAPAPGDVIGLRIGRTREAHVAICSAAARMIHATERAGVVEVALPAAARVFFVRRMPARWRGGDGRDHKFAG